MNRQMLWIAVTLVLGVSVWFLFAYDRARAPTLIGGDRDAHGCLTAGGYAYDTYVGACIRAFETTEGIKVAAKMAVEQVGQGYALTVVSFNSYEDPGSYDIMLERGTDRAKETVYIRGGHVVANP